MAEPNLLYYGDNLDVLRRHMKDETVDLVYLDPPFNSNTSYNVLFAEHGTKSAAQIKAFEDTWRWDEAAARDYQTTVEAGGTVSAALQAFLTLLGTSDMLAYLSMMAPRLVELRRVMKPTATIYLHCDPTASHYLKLLMDSVFGPQRFLNEIVWHYQTSGGAPKKTLVRDHDTILRYSKGPAANITWNPPREPWPESTLKKWQYDEEGRIYHIHNDTGTRYYVHPEGKLMDDVWGITLAARSRERLGYPTQKPLALLERILRASCDAGTTVLDPFCGCGTTVAAAQNLGLRWTGIDITHLAIGLIKHRLVDAYGPKIAETYRVIGEPTDIAGAQQLAVDDPFQFQAWALGLVGARVASSDKRGGDKGIDGRLYFHDAGPGGATKQIVFSVKAGHLVPAYLRDLRGVIEREKAEIGVLLSFEAPSAGMRAEAASAGFYASPWGSQHPRLQLLTVGQLLGGKTVDYPHLTGGNVTHRRAPRAELTAAEQAEISYGSDPESN
ncbi:MAG: DNA methyltransferase [Candidatus Dormibacteria bacterium]